jgi:uncharacterized protein YggU (UPF0235/DUF167 family)
LIYNVCMDYALWVKPGSKKGPLVERDQKGGLVVYVRERAVDGKANEAVVALLAEHFDLPKSHVSILHGQAARSKVVRIDS